MGEEWRWTGNPYNLLTPSPSDADYKEKDSRFHTWQTKEIYRSKMGKGSLNMFLIH